MKKVTLLSLVLILLAVTVVPVMAARGNPNSQGNGNSAGQGNAGGNRDQQNQQDRDRNKDQDRNQDSDRSSNPGSGGNGNHGGSQSRTPFYLQGIISALDAGAGTVTVTLTHGNAKVKEYIGTDLTLQTNENTMIFQITQGDEVSGTLGIDVSGGSSSYDGGTPSNRIPITFDQMAVGQKVAIHGNLSDSVYTARLITVYIQAPVSKSELEIP
jgi:hypothetical protein